jgi:holin-like protein
MPFGATARPRRAMRAMLNSWAILVAFQLVGEALRQLLHLPLPGPVIGMFLLAAGLAAAPQTRAGAPAALTTTAGALIGAMSLLCVPAGVGLITQAGVLRQAWLPVLAGLIGSTLLSLVVTALVMHHVARARRPVRAPVPYTLPPQVSPP